MKIKKIEYYSLLNKFGSSINALIYAHEVLEKKYDAHIKAEHIGYYTLPEQGYCTCKEPIRGVWGKDGNVEYCAKCMKRITPIKEEPDKQILEDLKKHKKHYFVSMEGHKYCVKCYAIKMIEQFSLIKSYEK